MKNVNNTADTWEPFFVGDDPVVQDAYYEWVNTIKAEDVSDIKSIIYYRKKNTQGKITIRFKKVVVK